MSGDITERFYNGHFWIWTFTLPSALVATAGDASGQPKLSLLKNELLIRAICGRGKRMWRVVTGYGPGVQLQISTLTASLNSSHRMQMICQARNGAREAVLGVSIH